MSSIYFFSGPCGCGKSTLANAYAKYLVDRGGRKQVYLIHGDDFHAGFIESDSEGECFTDVRGGLMCSYIESDNQGELFTDGQASDGLAWKDILKFNWDCILTVARKILDRGLDVVIDYVIEEELPLVQKMAEEYDAKFYYVVLTASEDAIRNRITRRGDVEMIERALFLKNKLDHMPENQGYLFDNTERTIEQEVEELEMEKFRKR